MRSLTRWATRWLLLHRFDGNPLRRRSDRIETAAALVALVIFVAVLWPAVALGRQVYEHGVRAEVVGPGHKQAVVAQVVDPARDARWQARTVRWTTAQGDVRTGPTVLAPGTPVGSHTRVWIDAAGRLTTPPPSHAKTVVDAALAVLATAAGVATTLLLCLTGVRKALNRRRDADWERAWAVADERWRRPRQP
ncbi:hypothetical protein GCM10017673_29270 [Streptosporangium violaceochromogenes]|nr:hypothetical protein GCM10017673_29270 [Streptosporangium violaceochromogenes]